MVGAQDVCAESGGAFTGQVGAAMLKDVGCSYVIVGHSERRRWYHEDDTLVARKFAAALAGGLTPVLCVGETLEEREAHQTEAVVARQVDAVIAMHGAGGFAGAVLAYEPVWAIGTGRTAITGAGARSACVPARSDCARMMLRWRAVCAFCTAAASRPAMPRSCLRCPTWMADWWAALR